MTAKELLKMLNDASDTAEIKIIDGEITITEPKKIEYKFKVGDKVIYQLWDNRSENMTVTEQLSINGCPCYILTSDNDDDFEVKCMEEDIHPHIPQDITERIKTFDDACKWCVENGKSILEHQHNIVHREYSAFPESVTSDLIAYLKLRIITCALNEGWEANDREFGFVPRLTAPGNEITIERNILTDIPVCCASKLWLKSEELAVYASQQFADIYADFCDFKEADAL